MTTATLDRVLAVLVLAMVATGGLTLRAGAPGDAWVFGAHGLLGGALLAAVALKLRRSVPAAARAGRWGRLALGLAVTGLALGALLGGFAWVAGGRLLAIEGWTVMTLHAIVGLLVAPLLTAHLLPRRWRLLRPARRSLRHVPSRLLSRRSVLAGGALAAISLSAWSGASVIERLRGGERRFTGSRWLPPGGVPPVTTFLGEGTQHIDPATWSLTVRGLVERPVVYSLAELRERGERDLRAVLDCTSGWALDTTWRAIPLAAILDEAAPRPGARRVDVRAVTGWTASFDLAEARETWLATGVAGAPLAAGNGAPCRLVVPGRRGLDWVKWVSEIVVSDGVVVDL